MMVFVKSNFIEPVATILVVVVVVVVVLVLERERGRTLDMILLPPSIVLLHFVSC